jgi:hypothetical protein
LDALLAEAREQRAADADEARAVLADWKQTFERELTRVRQEAQLKLEVRQCCLMLFECCDEWMV